MFHILMFCDRLKRFFHCSSRRIHSDTEEDHWTEKLGNKNNAKKLIGKQLFDKIEVLVDADERREAAEKVAG